MSCRLVHGGLVLIYFYPNLDVFHVPEFNLGFIMESKGFYKAHFPTYHMIIHEINTESNH
jgi:hypothetical protein